MKKSIVSGSNFSNSSNSHRYNLEKNSKKHICPNCYKKTFVLYIDTEKGEYLPLQYGRCDRESKCSYHLNPYLDGYSKSIWEQERKVTEVTKVTVPKQKYFRTQNNPQPKSEIVFFDFKTFKQTLQTERYEKNTFIQNLFNSVQFPFEVDEVTKVVQLYRLGTVANGYRAGANTFPFIDINGNVRAIQVKQFDEHNRTTGTDFLHSIIEKHHTRNNKPLPKWLESYTKQDKRISCLFGEQLLSKYHSNPVALVEAPKTAVYGTLYFGLPETPESLIWLAVYNKSSFSFDKLKVLKGRFVYVFPDLSKEGNTFKEWETKAKEYEIRLPGTRFIFSDLLEQLFRNNNTKKQSPKPKNQVIDNFKLNKPYYHVQPVKKLSFSDYVNGLKFENGILINGEGYPADWDIITTDKTTDLKTKSFVKMAIKNPKLLELKRLFELQ
jgi:hypothetical protein